MLQDVPHMLRNHAVFGLPQMYLSGLPWRGEIKRANRAQYLSCWTGNGRVFASQFSASIKVRRG